MITSVPELNRATPALAGRSDECRLLWRMLERATNGQCRTVLVTGEPGIGKTRLLDELAIRAAEAGVIVLRGAASEAEGMPPYLPFLEALGTYVRAADAETLRDQAGGCATTLAGILPEIIDRLGEISGGYPLPPEQARLRLFEAVRLFLEAIAAPHGLVVLLDDLHWADAATLDLLCHIAGQRSNARLFLLCACRRNDRSLNPGLERLEVELVRRRLLTTVALGPLIHEETGTLAASFLGAPADARVVQLVFSQGEGNPFFTEELLRGWVETGSLVRGESMWSMRGALEPGLPSGIVGAVRQRLGRLPGETIAVLRAASIVGRTFEVAVLAAVTGDDEEQVEDFLLAAERTGLIRAGFTARGAVAYTFVHDCIRECLAADMTATRRRRLHQAAGTALEGIGAPADAHILAEIAFHFAQSGDRARGAAYAQRAALAALEVHAPADALVHYRSALALVDPLDERRGELLMGLGEAALLTGEERAAADAFAEARAWYVQAGAAAAAGLAAYGLGRAYARLEALQDARAALESARDFLQEQPAADLARVLMDLATILAGSMGDQAGGLDCARQAVALAERLDDARVEAAACRTMGNLLVRGNDIPTGLPLLERALALAEVADDPVEAAECCACLATAYYWSADLRRSQQAALRRRDHALRCRQPYQMRHVYSWLALIAIHQGDHREAARFLTLAVEAVEHLASPEPTAFLHQVTGILALQIGDAGVAQHEFDLAMPVFREGGPGILAWYLGWHGLACLANGKESLARRCLHEIDAIANALPPDILPLAPALACRGLLALRLGYLDGLAATQSALSAFAGQHHWFLVDRVLGMIQIALEDWQAARDYLDAAEARARFGGFQPELARTLEAYAELELLRAAADCRERALVLLAEARSIFGDLGMAAEESRAASRSELLTTAVPPADSRPATGLTARETAVVRLLAGGLSNRQIAQTLAISEKTVANHLTGIFGKLGVDNRAAAAAFAVRHALA